MRAHQVTIVVDGETLATRFCKSQADASKKRTELAERYNVKRQYTDSEEVDVPTDKEGLLEFLNNLAETADKPEEA